MLEDENLNEPQNPQLNIGTFSGDYCPICKSDYIVYIDDYYTKCRECGFISAR